MASRLTGALQAYILGRLRSEGSRNLTSNRIGSNPIEDTLQLVSGQVNYLLALAGRIKQKTWDACASTVTYLAARCLFIVFGFVDHLHGKPISSVLQRIEAHLTFSDDVQNDQGFEPRQFCRTRGTTARASRTSCSDDGCLPAPHSWHPPIPHDQAQVRRSVHGGVSRLLCRKRSRQFLGPIHRYAQMDLVYKPCRGSYGPVEGGVCIADRQSCLAYQCC